MATIKSYTDIEQSKKLLELGLNAESADMCYEYDEYADTKYCHIPTIKMKEFEYKNSIPCWSIGALLGILPNNKKESTTLSRGGWKIESVEYIDKWFCEYEDEDSPSKNFSVSADNPVDACYETILKLHELNLL